MCSENLRFEGANGGPGTMRGFLTMTSYLRQEEILHKPGYHLALRLAERKEGTSEVLYWNEARHVNTGALLHFCFSENVGNRDLHI